jgi:hypothetical protein
VKFGVINKQTGAGAQVLVDDTAAANSTKATGGTALAAYTGRDLTLVTLSGGTERDVSGGNSRLGIQFASPSPDNRDWMFRDLVRTARFGSAANASDNTPPPLDANGWPTADFGLNAIEKCPPTWAGLYEFRFTGTASIVGQSSPVKVVTQVYDSATNTTRGDLQLSTVKGGGELQMFLKFIGTKGGVKDLKIFRPGYTDDADNPFTGEFLNLCAPAGLARWQGSQRTNHNLAIVTPDSRPKLTDATWANVQNPAGSDPRIGVPVEVAIDFSRRTGKGLYVNIPGRATDDYVRLVARMIKQKLPLADFPQLRIDVEIWNEIWNPGFKQALWARGEAARQIKEEPQGVLNTPVTNPTNGSMRWAAWRTIQVRSIILDELGPADPRWGMVLSGQHGWPELTEDQLAWVEMHFGPAAKFFRSIGLAPYTGGDVPLPAAGEARTADQWAEQFAAAVARILASPKIVRHQATAAKYKLELIGYEIGTDGPTETAPDAVMAVIAAAQQHPRAGDLVDAYLRGLMTLGFAVAPWLNLGYRSNKHGIWGLVEDPLQANVPKYNAWAAACPLFPQPEFVARPAEDSRDAQIRGLSAQVAKLQGQLDTAGQLVQARTAERDQAAADLRRRPPPARRRPGRQPEAHRVGRRDAFPRVTDQSEGG